MIELGNQDAQQQYRQAVRHARRCGLYDQWRETIRYLATYANGPGCRYDRALGMNTKCVLWPDFAPYSFQVVMYHLDEAGWQPWFNGGLIFQSPAIPANGGAPSFTVSLDSRAGWHLHT